MKFYKLRYY